MDYRKLDPALAAALAKAPAPGRAPTARTRASQQLSVFVQVDPDASDAQQAHLVGLGLPRGSFQGGIATATLSPEQVGKLSEQPFVRRIRLSAPLNLLGDEL